MLMNLKPWINFMSPGFCSVLVILLKLEMMENEEINFHNQSVERKRRLFGTKYHNNKKVFTFYWKSSETNSLQAPAKVSKLFENIV